MSVRVRLTRVGSKKNAVWRVVVADQRSPRDGRIIESLGHYNPQTQPSTIVIDRERLRHWIDKGAQPTNTVQKLMRAPDTVSGAAAAGVPESALASPPDTEPPEFEPPAPDESAPEAAGPDEAGSPEEGADAPAGAAASEAHAGPSGAAVDAGPAPADGEAAPAS